MSETWTPPPGVLATMLHWRESGAADIVLVELAPGAIVKCDPHAFVERVVVVVGLVNVIVGDEEAVLLSTTGRRDIEIQPGRAHRIESAFKLRTAAYLSVMSEQEGA